MQFVHEQPERDSQRKKRLRVVTSCDMCRQRKVKCVQSEDGKCVACGENGFECRFHDKERYYAEKRPSGSRSGRRHSPRVSLSAQNPSSQAMYGQLSPLTLQALPNGYSHDGHHTSADLSSYYHHADLPSSPTDIGPSSQIYLNGYELEPRGMAAASCSPISLSPVAHSPAHSSGSSHGSSADGYGIPQQLELFDTLVPGLPSETAFRTLLQVFFQRLGSSYPYLDVLEIEHKFNTGMLSPALASAIAAAGAPLCTHIPEFASRNVADVSAAYLTTAKGLINSLVQSSISLSGLHAIMVVAWSCYHVDQAQFSYYSQLALQVGRRFGIDNTTGQMALSQGNSAQLHRIQSTWQSILVLAS